MKNLLSKFGISNWRRHKVSEIKSFREKQAKEEAFELRDRGFRTVPLDQIVGSVGRYHDFDSKFQLKQHLPHDRLDTIKKAMRDGKAIAPVDLYQIKDEYYVLDGNHRISAAKELGHTDISARIIELIPSKNTLENIRYRERAEFYDKTGLSYAIELTELGQYGHLIEQITKHQDFLEQELAQPVSFETAAEDWYKTIYLPLVGIIKKGGLIKSFPERTIADLYAYISFHQWERGRTREYGLGIDELIPKEMEDFRRKMSNKKETQYPEMLREITSFILMHVAPKREYRIIENLYALDEVREVHSVHGDVDIIAKIVLKRDLLSSDAEIIGQFVHNKVRQIPGVISTQTLIPGLSKIKENRTV